MATGVAGGDVAREINNQNMALNKKTTCQSIDFITKRTGQQTYAESFSVSVMTPRCFTLEMEKHINEDKLEFIVNLAALLGFVDLGLTFC